MKLHKLIVLALCIGIEAHAQNLGAPLIIQPQFNNAAGNPLALGKLCSYDAGTDSPRATFSNRALTIANDKS